MTPTTNATLTPATASTLAIHPTPTEFASAVSEVTAP